MYLIIDIGGTYIKYGYYQKVETVYKNIKYQQSKPVKKIFINGFKK